MALELVETVEVGAVGAASITFSSLPTDAIDLMIITSVRSNGGNSVGYINFNGSSTDQTGQSLYGSGSGTSAGYSAAVISAFATNWSYTSSNVFAPSKIYISDYQGSHGKSVAMNGVTEQDATLTRQWVSNGFWNDTSAITSITLLYPSDNFVQYSTASLYKIY